MECPSSGLGLMFFDDLTGFMVLRERPWGTSVPNHILSGALAIDLTCLRLPLVTWLRECLAGFSISPYKVTSFPAFPVCALRRDVPMHRPHLKTEDLCSISLWNKVSTYIIWDSSAPGFVHSL